MVTFLLLIAADLKNIVELKPNDGVDDPEFCYYFKVQCTRCFEVNKTEVCLSLDVAEKYKKEIIHLKKNCDLCKLEGTVKMLPGKGLPLTTTRKKHFSPLMAFECEGYQLLDFVFSRGWTARSVEDTVFRDVDLSNGRIQIKDGNTMAEIWNLRSVFKQVDLHSPKKRKENLTGKGLIAEGSSSKGGKGKGKR